MIALSGPPGNGLSLFVPVVVILACIALVAELLGRREVRRRKSDR